MKTIRAHMLRLVFGISLVAFAAGCAAPGAVDRDPEPTEQLPQPADIRLADFEDFDVSAYPESLPEEEVIEHDVPEILMEGSAREGTERVAQGYRIQISSSIEKDDAVHAEAQAQQWWRSSAATVDVAPFPSELPTYVVFLQPYYRVRIGNFATRDDAAAALPMVEAQFPGSFIVPDTVTLRGE